MEVLLKGQDEDLKTSTIVADTKSHISIQSVPRIEIVGAQQNVVDVEVKTKLCEKVISFSGSNNQQDSQEQEITNEDSKNTSSIEPIQNGSKEKNCKRKMKRVFEVVEGAGGSNILIPLDNKNDCIIPYENGIEDMEVDECKEESKPSLSIGSEAPNCSKIHTPPSVSSSTKKSNLRRISKYESFSESFNLSLSFCTPLEQRLTDDSSPTPRKRIRIVEESDTEKKNTDKLEDNENDDLFSEMELISGHTFPTNHGDEEMVWVKPPLAPLDFTLVSVDVVRAARVPVTRKFSVEIDMHFIDGESINSLLECKPIMITAGYFNYEQMCRKTWLARQIKATQWKYPTNALNLKRLDEGINLDLTYPKDLLESENSNIFYFADIWVTSKGFREYILTKSLEYLREGLIMKGFAIQDSNGKQSKDFIPSCGILFNTFPTTNSKTDDLETTLPVDLVDHYKAPESQTFIRDKSCSYDICDILVSDEYVRNILAKTGGAGVHLLVADNPEFVNVHETVREVRYQRKLYAQCIIALLAVREGGSFVVKIFDSMTLFTVGLVFLMHRCFQNVSIHKPKTSAPHLSERFLVCVGKISCETSEQILQFLLICHNMVMNNEEVRKVFRKKVRRRLGINRYEVKQLVPLKVIIGHADFFEFLRIQNIRFTKSLVEAIHNLCVQIPVDFEIDWILNPPVNTKMELEEVQKAETVEEFAAALLKTFEIETDMNSLFPTGKDVEMSQRDVLKISRLPQNWVVFPVQDCDRVLLAHKLTLFIGIGGEKVFYWDDSKFKPVVVKGLVLTRGTIVFGNVVEMFPALNGDGGGEGAEATGDASINLEFHIIDAISLNGKFIGDLQYAERKKLCEAYATVSNNRGEFDYLKCAVIRVRKPLVLKKGEPVLKSWLKSCVYVKKNVCNYSGIMRFAKYPDADATTAMSVGQLLFYNISADIQNALRLRTVWNWTNPHKSQPLTLPIISEFPELNI